jgi:superfamily II DNA or RNA helicase
LAVTIDFLKRLVKENPGLSARRLAYLCREKFGLGDIRRKNINSLLYSNRSVFKAKGSAPPQWFIATDEGPRDFSGLHRNFIVEPERTAPRRPPPESVVNPGSPPRPHRRSVPDQISWNVLGGDPRPDAISTSLNEIEFRPWQLPAVNKWKENNGRGVIEAVTGTGKTHCGLFLTGKYVEAGKRVLILVPTTVLLRQWLVNLQLHLGVNDQYINILGDGNKGSEWQRPITIGIVNSVYKRAEKIAGIFALLIADECHRYASPSYGKALLPSIPHRLGLTATLERSDDGVEEILLPYFSDVCFSYGFSDALRDDVIARYSVISIGVHLTEDERDRYEYFGQQMSEARYDLQHDYGYSKNPKKFLRQVTANKIRGRAEGELVKMFTGSMSRRKEILSTSESKLRLAPVVAGGIRRMQKSVVFCETTESADLFTRALNGERIKSCSYHSGKKPDVLNGILEDLADGELDCLVSVRKLDEGVDIDGLDMGVILAGTRQRRQMIQRLGRIIRKKNDGRNSILIHIYAYGTSEDPKFNKGEGDDNQNFEVIYENATCQFDVEVDSGSNIRGQLRLVLKIMEANAKMASCVDYQTDMDEDIPF